MQDHDLHRTAESIWTAWLDLSYAFADLNDQGDSQSVRLGIGASIEKLRIAAETIERIAAASGAPRRPSTDASSNATTALIEGVLRVAS